MLLGVTPFEHDVLIFIYYLTQLCKISFYLSLCIYNFNNNSLYNFLIYTDYMIMTSYINTASHNTLILLYHILYDRILYS